jgi:beta-lactamase superfamily II metal-dependent hydrolase
MNKIKSPSADKIIVRMYNIGFGDCFLLLFPAPDNKPPCKVLIDCGVHMASKNPKALTMKDVVKQIVTDVTDPDGKPRIDIVIATHRHRDHVYGFQQKDWANVIVKEVWMPWTEHPTDPEAKQIRESQSKAAAKVKKALQKKKLHPSLTDAEREKLERATFLADNNLVNEAAMATLHTGFAHEDAFAVRRYLPLTDDGETFDSPALPGVKIHAMGPSHDPNVIADMEKDDEFYHLLGGGRAASESTLQPFRQDWVVRRSEYNSNQAYKNLKLSDRDIKAIGSFGGADEFAAAAKVESAVNGTSLMLMFEIGSGYLLFPGDAQWGTWDAAMKNPKWASLLGKTTFYKIGHHGSHNATPRKFVEGILKPGFWAMACTGPTAAWTEIIPRQSVLDALRTKSDKVVRSDKVDVADPTVSDFERDQDNDFTELELKF